MVNRNAIAAVAAVFLLLGAGASMSAGTQPDRSTWKAKFQRPAEIPFPEGNSYSEAKAKLGRMLFFDPILSESKTHSCSSCHNPGLSWADGLPRAIGEATLRVRAPTLLNVAWTSQARLGRTLPQSGSSRLRSNLHAGQHEYAGGGTYRAPLGDPRLSQMPSMPPSVKATSPSARSSSPWQHMSAPSYPARRRSTVGSTATRRPSARRRNADLICLSARRIAPHATAAGHSPMRRFTTLARQRAPISVVGACFPRLSGCATPSRRPRCVMSPAARLTCMMVRCRRLRQSSISTIVAGSIAEPIRTDRPA